MRMSFAILATGILVALSTAAILWATRYEVRPVRHALTSAHTAISH